MIIQAKSAQKQPLDAFSISPIGRVQNIILSTVRERRNRRMLGMNAVIKPLCRARWILSRLQVSGILVTFRTSIRIRTYGVPSDFRAIARLVPYSCTTPVPISVTFSSREIAEYKFRYFVAHSSQP